MKKRFKISEDLNIASIEPLENPATQQAAKLGLKYVGLGRYEDPKTGQITHIIQNDQLVPYQKAIQTNTYKLQSSNDIVDYADQQSEDEQYLHQSLIDQYGSVNYKDDELDAINQFTSGAYIDINDRLSELPLGVSVNNIIPESLTDIIPQLIKSLDSALSKQKTQSSFVVYCLLDTNTDITQFKPNTTFAFKGYRPTTISLSNSISSIDQKNTIIMQIMIPVGSSGMYVDDFSAAPGETEFVLPRSSQIKIVSGPNKLVGEISGNRQNVFYFNCELINK